MKKTLTISVLCLAFAPSVAMAVTHWWEQPTVCKLDPTDCYTSMGIGYESEMWDSDANCWGMKLICPEALNPAGDYPVTIGRNEIKSGTGINSDFDTNVLNGDCFGVRKTKDNGAMAMVNGEYTRVWCNGILDTPDEYMQNGEITYGAQPTCAQLAEYGYVAAVNNNCYGKYYDQSQYYIECNGNDVMPSRLILLNGADYTMNVAGAPADESAADKLFDKMESTSESQRGIYCKD